MALFGLLACGSSRAQVFPSLSQDSSKAPAPVQDKSQQNVVTPCIQPPPLVSWEEYQGPLKKVVGAFGRRLDRKSVRAPHYKPGAMLCTLEVKDKFILFVQDTFDPVTFLGVGFQCGH